MMQRDLGVFAIRFFHSRLRQFLYVGVPFRLVRMGFCIQGEEPICAC